MITINKGDAMPDGAKIIEPNGDGFDVYFADDARVLLRDLKEAKGNKQIDIERAFSAAMSGGFISEATGESVSYGTDIEDQINLIGAAMAGVDLPFKGKGPNDNAAVFKAHTAAQMQQVFADGVAYKLAQIQKRDTLLEQIRNATTIEQAEAITW